VRYDPFARLTTSRVLAAARSHAHRASLPPSGASSGESQEPRRRLQAPTERAARALALTGLRSVGKLKDTGRCQRRL
jgi:hypothetical protein